jgi:hypothetical protein
MEKRCKNCYFAEGYNGFDDHYCEYSGHYMRAEEYDCEDFEPFGPKLKEEEENWSNY